MLRRTSADRRVAAGGAIAGLGGSGVVAYYVYVVSERGRDFWSAPGVVSAAVLLIGLVLLVSGLFARTDEQPPRQSQQSGDSSTNLQAGRDLQVGDGDPEL